MARLMLRLTEIEEEFQLYHNVQETSRALEEWAKLTTRVTLEFLLPKDHVFARFSSLCEALLIFQAKAPPSDNDKIAIRPIRFAVWHWQKDERLQGITLFRTMAEVYDRESGRFAEHLTAFMFVMLGDDPTLAAQVDKIEGLMADLLRPFQGVNRDKAFLFYLRAQDEDSRLAKFKEVVKFNNGRWDLELFLKNFIAACYKDEICGKSLTELVKDEVERLTGVSNLVQDEKKMRHFGH